MCVVGGAVNRERRLTATGASKCTFRIHKHVFCIFSVFPLFLYCVKLHFCISTLYFLGLFCEQYVFGLCRTNVIPSFSCSGYNLSTFLSFKMYLKIRTVTCDCEHDLLLVIRTLLMRFNIIMARGELYTSYLFPPLTVLAFVFFLFF